MEKMNFKELLIESDRLVLEPVSHSYAQVIFQEFTDEITRYMFPATPGCIYDVEIFIESSLHNMEAKSEVTFVILEKFQREFLGVCGLHGLCSPDAPALGIWLKKSAHGHRYGREAIQRLVRWGKDQLAIKDMVYPCDRDNIASRKIAESLDGVVFRESQIQSLSGRVLNELVYKIS
ncbi:MAG: GNAT family N-acetyltransferase [Gammaproteobacteria bacterium]|nr:GNAT family N-acetyltransferase [Gammaproteobacteria bacterium]MDH5799789.1 GNAT family N-acetyltransferase [Gammaproteobacteria bacterium]